LAQRPELEHRVVERRLAFEEDAAELHDDAEAQGQRHRNGPHLLCHQRIGVDDDLGLPTRQPGYFDRALEPLGRTYPWDRLCRRNQAEPDPLALKPTDQGNPTALEQLSVGPGEPASGCKGTR
jgi:hypothetical protein